MIILVGGEEKESHVLLDYRMWENKVLTKACAGRGKTEQGGCAAEPMEEEVRKPIEVSEPEWSNPQILSLPPPHIL